MRNSLFTLILLICLISCQPTHKYFRDVNLETMEGIRPLSEFETKSYPYFEFDKLDSNNIVVIVWRSEDYSDKYRFQKSKNVWLRTYSYTEGTRKFYAYDYVTSKKVVRFLYYNLWKRDSIKYLISMHEVNDKMLRSYSYVSHKTEYKVSPIPDYNIDRINRLFPAPAHEFMNYTGSDSILKESYYEGHWNSDTIKFNFSNCYNLILNNYKYSSLGGNYFSLLKEVDCGEKLNILTRQIKDSPEIIK